MDDFTKKDKYSSIKSAITDVVSQNNNLHQKALAERYGFKPEEINEEVGLDESFGAFTKKIMARFKSQFDYQDYHFELAKKLVADTVGSNSPQGKKILTQHEKLSILTKYDDLRPELAREKLSKNIDLLYDDIKDAEHSVKFRKDWEAGAKATAERLAANIAKSEKRKQDIERAKNM